MCRLFATIVGFSIISGCSTLSGPKRIFTFAGIGGAAGVISGGALSPNSESRALNSLVFGLAGALAGGAGALLTEPRKIDEPKLPDFFDRTTQISTPQKEMVIAPYEALPDYVKKRLQPIVIEEFVEADQVDEDGILREAHKAYRIKRQPEFNPRPLRKDVEKVSP